MSDRDTRTPEIEHDTTYLQTLYDLLAAAHKALYEAAAIGRDMATKGHSTKGHCLYVTEAIALIGLRYECTTIAKMATCIANGLALCVPASFSRTGQTTPGAEGDGDDIVV